MVKTDKDMLAEANAAVPKISAAEAARRWRQPVYWALMCAIPAKCSRQAS